MYEYLDRRYALALYEIAEAKGKAEEYIKELDEVVELINSNNEIMGLIRHPQLSTGKKKEIFKDIFKKSVNSDILSFLLLLVEKGRINFLEQMLIEMKKIHLERNETLIANVKTVIPLKDDEREELTSVLSNKYKKKILLEEEIDMSIIGGVYVRVGNDVIDGTIKSEFDEIRKLTTQVE